MKDNKKKNPFLGVLIEEWKALVMGLVISAIAIGTNYLANVPSIVTKAGIEACAFIIVAYYLVEVLRFSKKPDLKEENKILTDQYNELRQKVETEKNDVNDYFLLWLHQIKTPITAAKLLANENLDSLNEDEKLVRYKEINRKINGELIHIDKYTNMALNYLKAMENDTDVYLTKVELDKIIRPLIKKYSTIFIDKRISLEYNRITAEVITDSQWCQVAVEQILSNAVKYTEKGTIKINFDEAERKLNIIDTGIGINQSDLHKIFDRGYSGVNGRDNDKSTGIGLFLTKKIADKVNLHLSVTSEVGKGSCFTIQFPEEFAIDSL